MTHASQGADIPIVGIGASAGGIEALEGFFRGVPSNPGLGFVVVTHLSPERETMLHEIIGRFTDLGVQIATDETAVEADNVYVIPSGAVLGIENRRLRVGKLDATRRERKPIDVFFSALAADLGELSAGVVLSGGDGDGTLGVKAIKERGGLTLAQVQDGYGPGYSSMPDSAIAAGFVDFAIPANQMGDKLVQFAQGLDRLDHLAAGSGAAAEDAGTDAARQEICAILRTQVGHEFGGYKVKTFLRRVQRRMQVRQIDTIEAYVGLLRQEPQEGAALFRDLLINVTSFFRDAGAFDALAATVIPALFEGRTADDTVRVWAPGCATGEEVFSLAILTLEHIGTLAAAPRVQLFATDIDEHALSVARAGRYPAALLDGVSPERRERFFTADGGSYVVGNAVRDLCTFSPHNVIGDPPFSRIDLVSCRNLLIYFGPDVQAQVIPTFHYALRPEGFLFLGTSENISPFGDLFAPVEKTQRIFRRRSDVVANVRLPLALARLRPGQASENHHRRPPSGVALRQAVQNQVLEQFAPQYVVVNRDGEIVFYSGRTGKYLEAAAGMPTRQILATARKGLRLDLRTTLDEAVRTGRAATRDSIAVEGDDGRVQVIALTVAPVTRHERQEPLYLVLFSDYGPALSREAAAVRASSKPDGDAAQLESELREARERLQSMIEQSETALEELKSSNEELVSVNEELQSTNEELEASKEELQSLNEELHTLNADLSHKIDLLDRANDDLQNLFESTEIAMVFLDRNLAIRSFTPAVEKVFYILPGDRGRRITDLASRCRLPDFASDIADVLATQEPIERRVAHEDGETHYLLRLRPYHDDEPGAGGVVIAFIDVTSLSQSEARQLVLIAELQHRTRNLLAIVQSLARQTFGRSEHLHAFDTRLAALGRVQGLISNATDDAIELADVIRLELQAHGYGPDGRVALDGPPVFLDSERMQTLALALHELTTNALKYGALKGDQGRLEIVWEIVEDGQDGPLLLLNWRESGVAMPPEVSRRGYGAKLIEKALTFTLRARTTLVFGKDGVSCRVEMPLRPGAAGPAPRPD